MRKRISIFCIGFLFITIFTISPFTKAEEKDLWIEQSKVPFLEIFTAYWCEPCLGFGEVLTDFYDSQTTPFQFLCWDNDNHAPFMQTRRKKYKICAIPVVVMESNQEWIGFTNQNRDSIIQTIEKWSYTGDIELSAKEEHTDTEFVVSARYNLKEHSNSTIHFALVSHQVIKNSALFRNYVLDGASFEIEGSGEQSMTFIIQDQPDIPLLKVLVWVETEEKCIGNVWLEYDSDPFKDSKGYLSFTTFQYLHGIKDENKLEESIQMYNLGSGDAHFTLSSDSQFLSFLEDYTVEGNSDEEILFYLDTKDLKTGSTVATIHIHPLDNSISSLCRSSFQIRFYNDPKE